jgi:hypothetical protein
VLGALIVSILSLSPNAVHATGVFGPLKPFTSDGCSDFPEGTIENPSLWTSCCIAHDEKYWAGGTYMERWLADIELRECVRSLGESRIAEIMFVGVRMGGSPFFYTPFRWGYGWKKLRGYTPLRTEELEEAHRQLVQRPNE